MPARSNPARLLPFLGVATTIAMALFASPNLAHAQPTFSVVHRFTGPPDDGGRPNALLQVPDGTLYGTTEDGGASNDGTIFRMAPDGSGFAILYSFLGSPVHGANPNCLVQGSDGALYGTIAAGGSDNLGTVFEIAPDGSGYTMVYQFTGYPYDDGGAYPSV